MTNILLVRADQELFDPAAVERIMTYEAGFSDLRFEEPGGAILEAEFGEPHERTIVRLSGDRKRISLTGFSDAALQAALILQHNLDTPLRMFDTNYTFDLILTGIQTVEGLHIAIDEAEVE